MPASNGISFADVYIEVSVDGGNNWVNFSGDTNKVDISGGERAIGKFFVPNADIPVLTAGKRGSLSITANVVFDPTSGSPWETVLNAYENGAVVMFRWVPAGNAAGNERFTATGFITTPVYPPGDATSADMVAIDFTFETPKIERDKVPSS